MTVLLVVIVIGAVRDAQWCVLRIRDIIPLTVVALQPNVPMNPVKSVAETKELLERHLSLSKQGLKQVPDDHRETCGLARVANELHYTSDKTFQELVANFTKENRTIAALQLA